MLREGHENGMGFLDTCEHDQFGLERMVLQVRHLPPWLMMMLAQPCLCKTISECSADSCKASFRVQSATAARHMLMPPMELLQSQA